MVLTHESSESVDESTQWMLTLLPLPITKTKQNKPVHVYQEMLLSHWKKCGFVCSNIVGALYDVMTPEKGRKESRKRGEKREGQGGERKREIIITWALSLWLNFSQSVSRSLAPYYSSMDPISVSITWVMTMPIKVAYASYKNWNQTWCWTDKHEPAWLFTVRTIDRPFKCTKAE